MSGFDVIIVGAGHNGLTAGCYLAKAGFRVLVLERRSVAGGAAVTEEVFPGYAVSRSAYFPQIAPEIVSDLELEKFGYRTGAVDPRHFYPFKNGKHLFLYTNPKKTTQEIGRLSPYDAKSYEKFHAMAGQFAETVAPLMLAPPIPVSDILKLMEGPEVEEVVRYFLLTSVKDLVEELFESEEVRVAFCLNSVGNTSLGPDSIGTSYLLALTEGGHTYAVRGPGAASEALERAARSLGVTIWFNTTVETIKVHENTASSIKLQDGRTLEAQVIVSNADPKTTILKLVGSDNFDPDFIRKVKHLRNEGAQTKINLALNGLPNFKCIPGQILGPQHRAYTGIMDSVRAMEKAYYQCRFGELPDQPIVYSFMQSAWDNTVAPPGHHSVSVLMRYTPYNLARGSWEQRRGELFDKFLSIYQEHAPNIGSIIDHKEILSPLDIEQVFGIDQGHVSHLEQSLNQLLSFRPVVGFANYRMPIKGLYLCGAGAHPGGGVTGAPGYNAARTIREDWPRLKT